MTQPDPAISTTQRAQPAPVYAARLGSREDLRAAQGAAARGLQPELDEGLVQSYDTGLDADPFDDICDHLIVEDTTDGSVVGTYRLQTGHRARDGLGYYSEREFDFSPFEASRGEILELGRACIHARHRSFAVLNLLWEGHRRLRARPGRALPHRLQLVHHSGRGRGRCGVPAAPAHLAPPAWQARPRPEFACPLDAVATPPAHSAPAIRLPCVGFCDLRATGAGPRVQDRGLPTWIDVQTPAVVARSEGAVHRVRGLFNIGPERGREGLLRVSVARDAQRQRDDFGHHTASTTQPPDALYERIVALVSHAWADGMCSLGIAQAIGCAVPFPANTA